jgi:hypothetical protein
MGPAYGLVWHDRWVRSIPDPGFAGDVGAVDPDLAAALEAFDAAPADLEAHRAVLRRLPATRLLVPVVAILGEVEHDVPPGGRAESRLVREKASDMAAVLMTGRDGRTALLAFTGTPALRQWDPEARPVPVSVRQAAQAALQDQASALLIDVAGPVLFVVEGDDLSSLAAGHRLVSLQDGGWGWADFP